jgi:predicted RNA-binding protein
MRHWLCITNEENWKIVKKKNIWGIREKDRNSKPVQKLEQNDLLVFYIKQRMVGGVFKASSSVFKSDAKLFSPSGFRENETFPYRLRLERILVPERPIDFLPLVPDLSFIRRKDKKWAGSIFGKAMRQIPRKDYEIIVKELNKSK